jgi:hypothetical protein
MSGVGSREVNTTRMVPSAFGSGLPRSMEKEAVGDPAGRISSR